MYTGSKSERNSVCSEDEKANYRIVDQDICSFVTRE